MNEMEKRIRKRRVAVGLTQEALADKLGLQKSAIAKYENGRVENIKRSTLARMAEALRCSPAWLMGFDDQETEPPITAIEAFGKKVDLTYEQLLLFEELSGLNEDGLRRLQEYMRDLAALPKYKR